MALVLSENPNSFNNESVQTALSRTDPHISWVFRQVANIVGGHIIWFTILITITCAAYFTLLIRDFVILTFDWQW